LNRGIAKAGEGDCDGAIADFDLAIELDPGNVQAHRFRGFAQSAVEDYDGSIEDFGLTIALYPDRGTPVSSEVMPSSP